MKGFKKVDWSEHKLAKWLKKKKALDNWTSDFKSTEWKDPFGNVVAIVTYNGEGGLDYEVYLNKKVA